LSVSSYGVEIEFNVTRNVVFRDNSELDFFQHATYSAFTTSYLIVSRDFPLFQAKCISILLFALVVMCPYQCFLVGCMADSKDNFAVGTSCCCTGEFPSDNTDDSIPSAPEDCDCGDCFCRGALPENNVPGDTIIADLCSFLTLWVKLDEAPIVAASAQVESRSFGIPINASALELRASLSCWLI